MKLSVSLPVDDVAVLDDFAKAAGLPSRSAALQYAVRLLRHPDLEQQYAAAGEEWQDSADDTAWDAANADGIDDASR